MQNKKDFEELKQKFVYTCHTPVAAGHDKFRVHDVAKILKKEYVKAAEMFGKEDPSSDEINLTIMALDNSHRVNAVSVKHGEIMRLQFSDFKNKISSITNGVHPHTWISDSFQALFDKYSNVFENWREDPGNLANISQLKEDTEFRYDLFNAHQENKRNLIDIVKRWRLRGDVFTLGWARRITAYKRPALIFHNIPGLLRLAYEVGPIQIIMAGKAHPNDNLGAAKIEEILNHIDQLNDHKEVIRVIILENYDTYFGKLLTNSVDVWLNNPLPPFEASGTSGMKAILNGVVQLSTLDGWVIEARQDDIGWFFGYEHTGANIGKETNLRLDEDSEDLCKTLGDIIQLYYKTFLNGKIHTESIWIDKMIHCIEKSAFFNTHRMVREYHKKMWNDG